jgi:HD-like signal output (HDOD) protein
MGMELHMTIFLILVCLLLLLLLFLPLFRGGEQKKQRAGRPEFKKNSAPPPGMEDTVPKKPQSFTSPVFSEVKYSSLDMVAPPRKLKEIDEGIKTKIREILDIVPPLPASSVQLTNLLRNPQVSAKQVATLVLTNPLISSRILRTVNSSYFGLPTKVTSVGRAITLLGFNNVHSLVLQDALRAAMPTSKNNELDKIDELWLHSTMVSACSLYLSKNVLPYTEHDMGTIGLFHDIGKYFLTAVAGRIEAELETPSLILSTDSGIDHSLLGSMLADHWEMAEIVVKCIEYHHYPTFFPLAEIPAPYLKPAFILCLADLICKALGYLGGPDMKLLPIRQDYYDNFCLRSDMTSLVSPSLMREIEKARNAVKSYIEGR